MRRTALLLLLLSFYRPLTAQEDSLSAPSARDTLILTNPEYQLNDLIIQGNDSIPADLVISDSTLLPADTSVRNGNQAKNDIETTINYHARDSMIFEIDEQKLYLYGDTHIDYGNITLDADQTSIDWSQRTIKSRFSYDTLGRKRGKPVFSQGEEVYETDDILYNFKTERAVIRGIITEQEGAFMHGEDVKKNEEDELFIKGAKYTTCNLSDPHFFIESEKLKVVPGNKVVSGPFNLKFREVPTPLWFPFGMFPQPRKKASGIEFPSYGEERRRGFFLRDGGYYFGFSEYFDLRLTGDLYSKGGHSINVLSNYKVRYKFNGSFNFSYNHNESDDIESPLNSSDYMVRWSHRPETRGNSSFSASVNARTSSYNNNVNVVSQDFQTSISSQFSSNVSYNQRFRNIPFNMSTNLRHTQNVQTGIYSLSLPEFTMNMNRIYPFKNVIKSSNNPISKISFNHNFVARNIISNEPLNVPSYVADDDLPSEDAPTFSAGNFGELYDRAKIGGRHSMPVSTSFNLLKYFTVSPSFNYQEVWYTRELDYNGGYNDAIKGVDIDTIEGFSRAGSWSSGASVNTRLYGMYYLRGIEAIEAVRHVMTPSLSFSYNPDFGSERFGVYETVAVDSLGREERLSKYNGFTFGSPTGNENRSLGFSLTNNLEMKVRTKNDSINEFKKVKVFENLSFSTGYNFAADSFNLSNINWNARTSFFNKKVNLTLSGNIDPYVYVEDGTAQGDRINRYTWNNGQGFGNLSNLNTAISFSLQPKGSKSQEDPLTTPTDPANTLVSGDQVLESPYGTEEEKAYILQNPEEYVDFNLPWSLRVSYNINRRQTGLEDALISSHGVQFSGSLGLTGKTQISFNSGYDLRNKDFTQTRISVNRDLHCWTLDFYWVPFGRYQSFGLTIRPKASLLQDLKLEKRRNFNDFFGSGL